MTFFAQSAGRTTGSKPRRAWTWSLLAAAGVAMSPLAVAQNGEPPETAEDAAVVGELPAIPLKDGLKQLKRIRLKHFGQIRNTEIRQLGIAKLKDYSESKFYPHLLEIFAREDKDVRGAILDLLVDQKDERADTTIAYAAVFDKSEWFREQAAKRLVERMKAYAAEKAASNGSEPDLVTPAAARPKAPPLPPGLDSGVPWRVKAVISNGIKQKDDTVATAAANLAADLKLFDLIPAMVNAQVQQPTTTGAGVGGGGGRGALATILVGQQQAYVADLEPVVGDSAVGFDPTLGVVTSGTVLTVQDAVVVTYRTEIHYALRRLANAGWDGRRTDGFGFNQRAWREWYANEFLPFRQAVANGEATPAGEDTGGPG
jgi:hypothetical protein